MKESQRRNCPVTSDPRSDLAPLSEGSVVAYYLSEFHVPSGQEAAVDKVMATMNQLVDKEQRSLLRSSNSLLFDNVVSSGTGSAADVSLQLQVVNFSFSASKFLNFLPSSRHTIDFHLVQP